MTQKTISNYPNAASIVALVGGILIMLGGLFFLTLSILVIPYLNFTSLPNPPPNVNPSSMPAFVSGIIGAMGLFGLIAGVIVLISAVILRLKPGHQETWGILILVFSILSFLGPGGFIVGAILGIVGGVLTLRWKPPTQ